MKKFILFLFILVSCRTTNDGSSIETLKVFRCNTNGKGCHTQKIERVVYIFKCISAQDCRSKSMKITNDKCDHYSSVGKEDGFQFLYKDGWTQEQTEAIVKVECL